jgi:hypothetical protein
MCTIFHQWEQPNKKLPQTRTRVLVVVKTKYGGNMWTTIAEYVPKHVVLAEDFIDPDCDPGWLDIGGDGKEYAPEGWYESTIESESSLMLNGEIKWWAKLPAKPQC